MWKSIYKTEMSVPLAVCPSHLEGDGGEGGQEGGGSGAGGFHRWNT